MKPNDMTENQNNAIKFPIDKLSDNAFGQGKLGTPEEVAEQEFFDLHVGYFNNNKNRPCIVKDCCITFDTDLIPDFCKLSAYDRIVFASYCAVIKDLLDIAKPGEAVYCTDKQILQRMTGGTNKSKSTSVAVKNVADSMYKLRHTYISYNWSEQAKMYGIEDEQGYVVIESCLIPASRVKNYKLQNGSLTNAYKSLAMPDLYNYAEKLSQIISVSNDLLNIKVANTPDNLVIRFYLIQRIARMKNTSKRGKKLITVIQMKTLFKYCQIDSGF